MRQKVLYINFFFFQSIIGLVVMARVFLLRTAYNLFSPFHHISSRERCYLSPLSPSETV